MKIYFSSCIILFFIFFDDRSQIYSRNITESFIKCANDVKIIKEKLILNETDEIILNNCRREGGISKDFVTSTLIFFAKNDQSRVKNFSILKGFVEFYLLELESYYPININFQNEISSAIIFLTYMNENRLFPFITKILDKPINGRLGGIALWAEEKLINNSNGLNEKEINCSKDFKKQINENFKIIGCSEIKYGDELEGFKYDLYYKEKLIQGIARYITISSDEILFQEIKETKNDNEKIIYPGEFIYFKKNRMTMFKKMADNFDSIFSSPNIINNCLYYWGLEKKTTLGDYIIYATFYDFKSFKLKKMKLYEGIVATNNQGYFAKPFTRKNKVYFLYEWGGWTMDKDLDIIYETSRQKDNM